MRRGQFPGEQAVVLPTHLLALEVGTLPSVPQHGNISPYPVLMGEPEPG